MDFIHLLRYRRPQPILISTNQRSRPIKSLILSVMFAALLLTGCDTLAGGDTQPQQVKVNFFGTAANHVHYYLIAFPNNVLVLPTHFGLFRSTDGGRHWALVAFSPDQG